VRFVGNERILRKHWLSRILPPNGWALSCQAGRPTWLKAPKSQCQTLSPVDWNAL
jgi:hypothetical protein